MNTGERPPLRHAEELARAAAMNLEKTRHEAFPEDLLALASKQLSEAQAIIAEHLRKGPLH